jgi:hypothetical protein
MKKEDLHVIRISEEGMKRLLAEQENKRKFIEAMRDGMPRAEAEKKYGLKLVVPEGI